MNAPNQGGGTSEHRHKIKFQRKICQGEHLTHEFPRMDEVYRLLVLPPTT